jgi:MSHA biogenesis protein MshQ
MSGQGNPQKSNNYIDYFVIEEGVISLNNGESQIVAGLVDTKTAASQISSERNNADVIRYEDYGLDSFNSKPGILVQPQTKKNASAWFTGMARNVGVESFLLALEKSEVTKNNPISSKEKVAFVAGEGSGFIQGARFFLGYGETRVTTTLNERIISPVEIGCEEYTSIASAGFDGPPILVANKNSRSGNNGGWIRRCDITKD